MNRKKLALLLKKGAAAVMPTDTIYGICGSALNKNTVEKIYKLRKRSPLKPLIVLIKNTNDLEKFGVKISSSQKEILNKVWPGKVSVILKCSLKKFNYLHRGLETIAFRIPKNKLLVEILKISGSLIAPSANQEGKKPAKTIAEAKKYFGDKIIYYGVRKIIGEPSTLIKLKNGKFEIIRKGADFDKIKF